MDVLTQHNAAAGEDGGSTQEKILHAATELFAHQGFEQTTVQEICEKAGSNIASVNYHFGSKGKLYLAAWGYAAELADQVGGSLSEDVPADEWLRQMLQQRIQVIFADGPTGSLPRLIHNEMHKQTNYFKEIRQTFLRSVRERFNRQVSRYLGPKANALQRETAVNAIMGFFPMMIHLQEHRKSRLTPSQLTQLTEQTQAYVLGGLAAMKQIIEKEAP